MEEKYKDTDLREALRRKYSDTPQLPSDFMTKMQERMTQLDEPPMPQPATQRKLWHRVAAAACILLIIGVGIAMLHNQQTGQTNGGALLWESGERNGQTSCGWEPDTLPATTYILY